MIFVFHRLKTKTISKFIIDGQKRKDATYQPQRFIKLL